MNAAVEHLQRMQPPNSIEAEQSVLGGLMIDKSAFADVRALVCADDFYRNDHRLVFASIEQLVARQVTPDFVTVSEHIRNQGKLDEAGGLAYLGSLAVETYSVSNVRHYAEIVKERSLMRQLIALGSDTAQSGYRPEGKSSGQLIADLDKRLTALKAGATASNSDGSMVGSIMDDLDAHVEMLRSNPSAISGLSTGLTDFDKKTTGLHPGDLMYLGGRPSMGKSTLALNIAEHVAMHEKRTVMVFTMEMPKKQIGERLSSSIGRVPLEAIRNGRLDEQMWARYCHVGGVIRSLPIVVDDRAALTPHELNARARRVKAKHGLGLIVVDFVQLMKAPGYENARVNELDEISRSMKSTAKELEVPIIALASLNRSVETRNNKRPRMSDLRESGSLESDADLVVFIYRDEVYNPDSKHRGTAELLIEKQRNGPLGMVRVATKLAFSRFENLAPEYHREEELGFDE